MIFPSFKEMKRSGVNRPHNKEKQEKYREGLKQLHETDKKFTKPNKGKNQ